ncbi:amidohydrolase [Dysgonomonas sp. 511]|uniref:amidohydrolase n=1 Tax=Dysgonomonas sp. 511 TaxID=2302930 RepID=UPI0013CF4272|nr:amidohydrolase [Dysgonomonas sp. 511]NDV78273.1 amidohydrolase [Dysgonomonas sp. 511]
MNILLVQTDIRWQMPEDNRIAAQKIINTSPQADIIILPEMFTTGFCMAPEGVAEEADTVTLQWMQAIAREKDAAVCGSVATVDNGKFYNRFYFVQPDGEYSVYNKKHLFSYAGEHEEYEAGQQRVIVKYKRVRILLQICYDLRFPIFSRNRDDYDMAIYVANWPTSRLEAWNTLLKARAIENVCYVAGVNRTGNDPSNAYSGGTALINYLGQHIVAAQPDKEEAVLGEINMEELEGFRKKFPVLKDADNFTLI